MPSMSGPLMGHSRLKGIKELKFLDRIFLQTMESILQQDPEAIDISHGNQGNQYTFFVPTDTAFRSIGASRLRRLQTDPQYRTKVMKNHISPSMASSEAYKPNLVYDVPTRGNVVGVTCARKRMKVRGLDVQLSSTKRNSLEITGSFVCEQVNDADVVKKDIMSTNGEYIRNLVFNYKGKA